LEETGRTKASSVFELLNYFRCWLFFRRKNSMGSIFIRACVASMAMVFCGIAAAHPGHGDSYMAGVAHPLLGLDHLLAMVAVGVWASQLGGHARWAAPAAFVGLMALAGGMSMAGIGLPSVESAVATSVLLLGLLIAFALKASPALATAIVGVFAVFHGIAHGAEMPALATPWRYGFGFVMSTAALHGIGLLLGSGLNKRPLWLRGTGALVAASGALLMITI
jgi:urease accessory protein